MALLMVFSLVGVSFAQTVLDAKESDPNEREWMQGFPPAEDKILSPVDGSFFYFSRSTLQCKSHERVFSHSGCVCLKR